MPKKATFYSTAALALLTVVTLFRLFYCPHLELVGDEAYYWLWSRHLDYCYLDKGPTIAWLIAATQAVFGPTVFAIRLVAVMLGTGTGLAIFLLGRTLFNDRIGFWSVVIALVTPLFAVGAILTTIDTVYLFFWSFAALTFWKATQSDSLNWWIGTGILVGLSIWSKYTGAIQLVSFALFCIWDKKSLLTRPGLWIMAGVACIFFVPPFIWNWQHGWPTSSFLVHRGALDQQAHPRLLNVLAFLVQQAGVISPLIFLGILTSICFPKLARTPRAETNYLLALFLPLFVLYLVLSFQHTAQANWTAAAYIGGILLLVVKFEQLVSRRSSVTWIVIAGLVIAFLETAVLHETSWLHLPPRIDVLDRARGSRDLASKISEIQSRTGAEFIIANKYMTAALLSFYLPGQPTTYMPVGSPPFNQLVLWPTYRTEHPSGDALLVSDFNRVPFTLKEDFGNIRLESEIQTIQDGRKLRHFYVFLCRRDLARTAAKATL